VLYYQQAESQSDSGRKEEAVAAFEKAAGFCRKRFGETLSRRQPISGLHKTAAYERAESMLHRALELDEELHEARVMLINMYTKQNRWNDALDQAKIYLSKNPKSSHRADIERIKEQIERVLRQ